VTFKSIGNEVETGFYKRPSAKETAQISLCQEWNGFNTGEPTPID
jgi:hypothetical protein